MSSEHSSLAEEFLQLAKELGYIPDRPPKPVNTADVRNSAVRLERAADRLGGYLKYLMKNSNMDRQRLGKMM